LNLYIIIPSFSIWTVTGVDGWLTVSDRDLVRWLDLIGECWSCVFDLDRALGVCSLGEDILGWTWYGGMRFKDDVRVVVIPFLLIVLGPCICSRSTRGGKYLWSRWW
jgi:hypothetical protein